VRDNNKIRIKQGGLNMCFHQKGKCNGKCVIGAIIAIIFGTLFFWSLVTGLVIHFNGNFTLPLMYYFIAMIFIVIVKYAKCYAVTCGGKKGLFK
jgi:hypothetical protein